MGAAAGYRGRVTPLCRASLLAAAAALGFAALGAAGAGSPIGISPGRWPRPDIGRGCITLQMPGKTPDTVTVTGSGQAISAGRIDWPGPLIWRPRILSTTSPTLCILPVWIPGSLAFVAAAGLWVAGRPRRTGCPRCGYDTAGLAANQCPECGESLPGPR